MDGDWGKQCLILFWLCKRQTPYLWVFSTGAFGCVEPCPWWTFSGVSPKGTRPSLSLPQTSVRWVTQLMCARETWEKSTFKRPCAQLSVVFLAPRWIFVCQPSALSRGRSRGTEEMCVFHPGGSSLCLTPSLLPAVMKQLCGDLRSVLRSCSVYSSTTEAFTVQLCCC